MSSAQEDAQETAREEVQTAEEARPARARTASTNGWLECGYWRAKTG